MSISGPPVNRRLRPGLIVLWVMGVTLGIGALVRFDLRAGPATTPPATWPGESRLPRNRDGATLILFAHPRCPCTRASLAELHRILAKSDAHTAAIVVFIQPDGTSDEWVRKGALWESAATSAGVVCVADPGLREAAIFRARTSGQVVLYDGAGRRQYAGGITAARGHEGANAGEQAVTACLAGHPAPATTAPVFGCPLHEREEACRFGGKTCLSP